MTMRIRTIHKQTVDKHGNILPEWETPYGVTSYPNLGGYPSIEAAKKEILKRNNNKGPHRRAQILDDGSIRVEGDCNTYQLITFEA